jgi:hypothetical protein
MRIRTVLWALACCAALAACTAAPHKGPDATVTTPAVGRPAAPVSAQAALSSEVFTPYADIGTAPNDGLALSDTYEALHTACMTDAGYGQYANSTLFFARANRGLGFAQPWGPWGYLPVALAEQDGFDAPTSGPQEGNGQLPGTAGSSLPSGAQAAGGKCFNIVTNFNNAMFAGPLAGIETMNNEISNDVVQDPNFKKAGTAWVACMAKNGYTTPDADTFAQNETASLGQLLVTPGATPSTPTPAQQKAQIAAAVTDGQCTQSTDLAGIYWAVQASYEQQFVNSNQQALNVAVRDYKADFARELRKLPELLHTVSATPSLPGPAGHRKVVRPGEPASGPTRKAR